jgi:ribosylpyrimidine nucleosidase
MESQDKLTVVTTGPMTNLALAMRIEPKIIDKIEQVVLMGGSIANGNVSPAAEYNIYADPEAAHIVFNSGVNVLMVGLDVTRKLMVLPEIIKRMENINNRLSKLFVDLMNVFNDNQKRVFGLPGGPLHDPLTIAYLIDPTILTTRKTNCEIDITGGPSYGRTNVDFYDYLKQEKNIEVAIDVDVDKFWDLIESVLKMG